MKKVYFLSLPTSVVCNALSKLTLMEIVRLDSACCHRDSRAAWSVFLQSKQLTLRCSVDTSNILQLQWLHNKKLVASSIDFCAPVDELKVTEYLRSAGSRVREVIFRGGDRTQEINLVALYCRSLSIVHFMDTEITRAFNHLLWCNPDIREVWCERIECSTADIFTGLSLHKLEIMRVKDALCGNYNGFPWHKSAHCNSLHTFVLDFVSFQSDDINELGLNCPQLRSFACNRVDTWNGCLAQIVRSMVQVVNFSTSRNLAVVDGDILTVTQTMTALRSLNLLRCESLSDLSLQHIAEHCGDTLEVLCTDIKTPESPDTEYILEILGRNCVKLKYFDVNCGANTLCGGQAMSMLLRGCPSLHTLVVNKYSTICESSRGLVAMVRPTLKLLVHKKSTEYDIMVMSI